MQPSRSPARSNGAHAIKRKKTGNDTSVPVKFAMDELSSGGPKEAGSNANLRKSEEPLKRKIAKTKEEQAEISATISRTEEQKQNPQNLNTVPGGYHSNTAIENNDITPSPIHQSTDPQNGIFKTILEQLEGMNKRLLDLELKSSQKLEDLIKTLLEFKTSDATPITNRETFENNLRSLKSDLQDFKKIGTEPINLISYENKKKGVDHQPPHNFFKKNNALNSNLTIEQQIQKLGESHQKRLQTSQSAMEVEPQTNNKKDAQTSEIQENGAKRETLTKAELDAIRQSQREEFEKRRKWSTHFRDFTKELRAKKLYSKSIVKDGNCLFRAISHQHAGFESDHKLYRELAVKTLRENWNSICPYEENMEQYLREMSKDGTWGTDYELKALAQGLGAKILVTRKGESEDLIISPISGQANYELRIAFHSGEGFSNHFSSLVPYNEEIAKKYARPTSEPRAPIKWGSPWNPRTQDF